MQTTTDIPDKYGKTAEALRRPSFPRLAQEGAEKAVVTEDAGRPAFSFLLVNYNMAELVVRCIESIQRALPPGISAEFLVAENGSDWQFKLAPERLPNVRIIGLDTSGWVDALNCLIPRAEGRYCVLMHTDVELTDGCLSALYRYLESHPSVAMASPDLYYPNGSPCKIRTQFPTLRSECAKTVNEASRAFVGRSIFPEQSCWDRSQDAQVDMVMSVCMVVRQEILKKIGKIDARLRIYYANDYLAARAAKLGYTCNYVLGAKAIHFERFTASEVYSQSPEMAYKKDAFASLDKMQADYLVFLRELYSGWKVFIFRILLFLQDSMLLAAQLKSFRTRSSNTRHVIAAIRMLCFLKPQEADREVQNGRRTR